MPSELTVDSNGIQEWYNDAGVRHREGGLPAIVRADGDQEWYVNGMRHRDGGLPAIVYADGGQEWWVHGATVTEEEARRLSPPPPIQGPIRSRFHLIDEW